MSAEELNAYKLKCFDNLGTFYVDYILPMQNEVVLTEYPDYPNDFPFELRYKGAIEKKIKQEKVTKTESKTRSKPTNRILERALKLEEEASEFIGKTKKLTKIGKRRTRFSGSYQFEEEQSTKLSYDRIKKEVSSNQIIPKKISNNLKKTNKTLSDSSSSSDESDNEEEIFGKSFQSNFRNSYKNLSENSSDEEKSKKSDSAIDFKHKIVKVPSVKNQKLSNNSSVVSQLEKQRESQMRKLKTAFQNTASFDEAMKMYSQEIKKTKLAPPIIIPAPLKDPMMKLKKKIYKNQLPNADLGGIFTINNGWDKESYNTKKENNQQSKNVVPVSERCITPPPQHTDSFDRDVLNEDEFIDSSYDYRLNGFNGNLEDEDTDTENDEDEPMKLIISETNESNKDIASESTIETMQSKDLSQEIENEDKIITVKNPKNIRKISSSDDENEVENNQRVVNKNAPDENEDNDDAISISADYGALDDFDDDEPLNLHVELDDLKMKFKIERNIKQNKESNENSTETSKEEFDKMTKEIIEYAVDPRTDNILRKYFGNVCPAFLENRCNLNVCRRRHELTDKTILKAHLIRASISEVRDIFDVALRFYRLFHDYVSVFTEKFIINNDEQDLILQIKGCDRHVRTRECLREIARKIIDMGYMSVHKTLKFIIQHHLDSSIARETILHLILDSGVCIPYFMEYIENMYNQHTICMDDFNKILHACVSYQNPMLPNFCLNYLLQCTPERFGNIPKESLAKFLHMNKCLSELNENREAKLLSIVAKMREA
ncbi:hypothetical protein PVAND_013990 [Polypedilum vanderplanki]|uniref:Uncharacterized protein n=1 Tax=Polypedilum vanderplanki TaxID=319348 RepID=A0A9J6CRE3_POLVA|nr:hypothetical protein PVAND_013990 [Polypedilum vanderplanki]